MHTSELHTPALLVDLDKAERNLRVMSEFFTAGGVRLRPHFKNHKCIEFARWQVAAGANGMTCATIREAEHLVESGIESILIANEIASDDKFHRFLALSERAEAMVAVDNLAVAARLGRLALSEGIRAGVVLDVDIGLHRCGVKPGETAVELARTIVQSGLHLRGIMGYEGNLLRLPPGRPKTGQLEAAMRTLLDTKALIEAAGLPIDIVSVGGTGSYQVCGQFPGVTELQAGSYLLMETDYAEVCPEFEVALTVLTTVISKTVGDRVVLDAGLKGISCERGLPVPKAQGLMTEKVNAEHTILQIDRGSEGPEVGDRVELWVRYGDGTVNLHERMYGMRGNKLEASYPICK